jgi:hypothetical protein
LIVRRQHVLQFGDESVDGYSGPSKRIARSDSGGDALSGKSRQSNAGGARLLPQAAQRTGKRDTFAELRSLVEQHLLQHVLAQNGVQSATILSDHVQHGIFGLDKQLDAAWLACLSKRKVQLGRVKETAECQLA